MSATLQAIPLKTITGDDATLADYAGQVLLVVNVASQCGLTSQYSALEALHREKQGQGFSVLGFPANNFKGQEPGSNEEIAAFCSSSYDVTFPLFAKISVAGDDRHPLYDALTAARPDGVDRAAFIERLQGRGQVVADPAGVLWNFEKFLIGRDGRVIGRYAPGVAPDDARLRADVDAALTA
ncbi:glutathione peroxidase [Chitinolyticbacter meiyuanensis]|uniref:glutathione peroxidase n=1 Tax=Chitinolyticbacter meiyuanensis TaxID=682798 RepID=UPI0011E5A5B1|nr:glutathione peroxidase [Chitinolyticbacter meiyuanensis]